MKYQTEYRDQALASGLLTAIRAVAAPLPPVTFMEVCGSHTMAICRYGLREVLPANVRLLSGPGCPVCVTEGHYIDQAVALARLPDVTVTTFGDLIRVPGSSSSLEKERAAGAAIEVVFSPLQAVELARAHPERRVVFLGIGFETTVPGVALAVRDAAGLGLRNFFVLCGHKVMPPPLRALVAGRTRVDGFLLPGNVSAIIGLQPYGFLAKEFGIACAVAGFEPLDVLEGIHLLLRQVAGHCPTVENQYTRLVRPEGNPAAQRLVAEVFEPFDAVWRGIGMIPGSGLRLRPAFAAHDAERGIEYTTEPTVGKKGCICGEILQGLKQPEDCALFGCVCTPGDPVGACMVSSEGCCAAHYRYLRGTPGE
jgi:hydrogenase expression/formation protein HypD